MKPRGYSGVLITTSSLQEFSSSAHKNTSRSHKGFHIKYSRQITPRTTQEKGEEKKSLNCSVALIKEPKRLTQRKGGGREGRGSSVPPRGSAAVDECQRSLGFEAGAAPAEPTRGTGYLPAAKSKILSRDNMHVAVPRNFMQRCFNKKRKGW